MTVSSPATPQIITIFGATGFVGRAIVRELALHHTSRQLQIRVATRNPARAEFLRQLGDVGQVTPIACNPREAASVQRALAGSQGVVNCIGQLAETRRNRFADVQGEVPGIIARAIQAAAPGAAFVQISAIGADANSASAYARSKAAGEGVIRAILPGATILRPSVVFGPEDMFFNRFAKLALLSPWLPLLGGGQTTFQPLYVGDLARAVVAALQLPGARGQTYELGGPATYTFRELMQLMLKAIGRTRRLVTVPWGIALLQGAVLQRLPGKLLTVDQVKLLQKGNIAADVLPGLAQLGITPTAVEAVLPTYMDRFRPRGRFS